MNDGMDRSSLIFDAGMGWPLLALAGGPTLTLESLPEIVGSPENAQHARLLPPAL